MLEEFLDLRQRPEEGFRRLFSNKNIDIMIWYKNDRITITGFQISYDKGNSEKVITFKTDEGKLVSNHRFVSGGTYFNHSSIMTSILAGNPEKITIEKWNEILDCINNLEVDIKEYILKNIHLLKNTIVEY